METAIGQKSNRNDSRQTFPVYATGILKASPLFEHGAPSSSPVASKCPDLLAQTSPTVKRFMVDRKSLNRVSSSSSGFHFNQKVSSATPFTRLSCNYNLSHVNRQDQLADFKVSPPHCSCASVVATSAVHTAGKNLYCKPEELPLSALPQGRICVSRRTGRDELSPRRCASTGLLAYRFRKRHFASRINVNTANDVPGYGAFRSSPIPAQPEDVVSSSWRMRLRTQAAGGATTHLNGAIPSSSSVWGGAAANISGEQAERKQHPIYVVLGNDAECEPARLQPDRLSHSQKRPALTGPPLCDTVSECPRDKASTSDSSPPIVCCKKTNTPDAVTRCSRHLGSGPLSNHTSGSSGVTCIDTSCDSIDRQCDFTGACCMNGNADAKNSSSTTGCSSRTIMLTGDNHICTEGGLSVSAAPLRLEPVIPLLSSRTTLVTGSACTSSSSAIRTALCLSPSRAAPENSRTLTEPSSSSQVASYADSEGVSLTQGERCEKSCHTTDLLRRSGNHLATRSATTTERDSGEVGEHSAVCQEEPQRARHAKQRVAQQTEDAMPGSDTQAMQLRSPALVDRDGVTGKDAPNKSASPVRTHRSSTPEGQSESGGARGLMKTGPADEMASLPNNRAAQKNSPLEHQSKRVHSLLMPPPSPLHFFFPLHHRLPPQSLRSSSPDENIISLDDEERKARPATEFATVGSSTEDTPNDILYKKSSPTLIQSAVTDPDRALTCQGKERSADVGAPKAETVSGNSGATTSADAASAAEERISALSEDGSAPQPGKSKTFDSNNMFHTSGFDVKTPACLSFKAILGENDCITVSCLPKLERPHSTHHPGLASGQLNGGSAGKRCPYDGAASDKVLHDANELCNDTYADNADYSAAPHALSGTALHPHSAGVLSNKILEAIPATLESETLPKRRTTKAPACVMAATAQSKEESRRDLTTARFRILTPRTPQAAASVRGAKKNREQISSVVQSSKASLAEGSSVSSRSHLPEERPQQNLRTVRPLQHIRCVEALSLPVSSVSPYSTKHLQQKESPECAGVTGATAALTDPRLKRLVSTTAGSDFRGTKPTLKTPAGCMDKSSDTRAKAQGFLGEQNRRGLSQRPLSAAARRCDICRQKNRVCLAIGSPTGLLPKTFLSARRSTPETQEENNISVIPAACKAERSGCCDFRTSARPILNVPPIRVSPISDTAISSSVAGCTLCSGAGCVFVRTRCHPGDARPQTDILQPLIQRFGKRSLSPPRCSLPTVQTSGNEGICNGRVCTRHCEPSVCEGIANNSDTTLSTDERQRSLVTRFPTGRETLHASATAFPTCATPTSISPPSRTGRRSRATPGDVPECRVARRPTESFTPEEEHQITAPRLSSSNKKCSINSPTSSKTVLHKAVKRELQRRKMMSGSDYVRIRASIWQALQESIIGLVQSTSSPLSVGTEQRPTAFTLRSADSDSPRIVKTGKPRYEHQALYPHVDAVILPEKRATSTDSLPCATSKSRSYFGDGHQQLIKDFVDSSTYSASSSSTGSGVRGSKVAHGKEEAEITSREGRTEQSIVGRMSAYSVLHTAEGSGPTRQMDPCVIHEGRGSSLDTFPEVTFEGHVGGKVQYSREGRVTKTTQSISASLSSVSSDSLAARTDVGRKKLKGRTPSGDGSHRGHKRRSSSKPQNSWSAVPIDEVPRKCLQQRNDTREEHCNRSCSRSSRCKQKCNHTGQRSKVANSRFSRNPPAPADELAMLPSLSTSWPLRQMSASPPDLHTAERVHTSVCGDTKGRGLRCSPVEPEIEYKSVRVQKAYITSQEEPLQSSNQTEESSAAISKNRMLSALPGSTSHAVTNRDLNLENGARSSESQIQRQVCLRVCNRAHFHEEIGLEIQKNFSSHSSFSWAAAVTVVRGVQDGYLPNGNVVEEQDNFAHIDSSVSQERSFDSRGSVKETVQHSLDAHSRCGVSTRKRTKAEHGFASPSVHRSTHQAKYDTDDACSMPKVQLQQDSPSQVMTRRSRLSRSIRRKHSRRGSRLYRRRAASRVSGRLQSECRSPSLVQHFSNVYGGYTTARGNEGLSQASCPSHAPSSREGGSKGCDMCCHKESDPHSRGCCSVELEGQSAAAAQDTGTCRGWHVTSPFMQLMSQMLPAEDADKQNAEQQCATEHREKQMYTPSDCQKEHHSCSSKLKRDSNKSHSVDRQTRVFHTSCDVQSHSHACHIVSPFHARGEHEYRQSLISHPAAPCRVNAGVESGRCHEAASEDFIVGITFPPQRHTQIRSSGPSVCLVAGEAPRTLIKESLFNPDHECRNGLKPRLVEALNATEHSSIDSRLGDAALLSAAHGKCNERCVGADYDLLVNSPASKLDYCRPRAGGGPLVHATGSWRSFAEGGYLAVSRAGSSLESCSEPSTSSHADSDHRGCVTKKDLCFTRSERNSHKTAAQEDSHFHFVSPGEPHDAVHAEVDQPSRSCDVCTTSFPHCNYGRTGRKQTTAESAHLLESRRPSLSKMDMLIEKIAWLRQAVHQKEEVCLQDAAASSSSPAACGDNASPLPSSTRSETPGLSPCVSGKCLTLQSREGKMFSGKLEQNEKQIRPKE